MMGAISIGPGELLLVILAAFLFGAVGMIILIASKIG